MNEGEIRSAMLSGVSFVCAHCTKFWWGVEKKVGACRAAFESKECAGPLGGLSFPEYDGPLKGHLPKYCFVTGRPSDAYVRANDGGLVGITESSMDILETYSVGGDPPAFITKVKIDKVG